MVQVGSAKGPMALRIFERRLPLAVRSLILLDWDSTGKGGTDGDSDAALEEIDSDVSQRTLPNDEQHRPWHQRLEKRALERAGAT